MKFSVTRISSPTLDTNKRHRLAVKNAPRLLCPSRLGHHRNITLASQETRQLVDTAHFLIHSVERELKV